MSKMDALRAMREARYAAAQTRSAAAPLPAPAPVAPSTRPARTARKASAPPKAAAAASTEACGHRNMSGRSCTRPQGHREKSHRYS